VQSRFPGVGSIVPYGEADVRVVTTQAFGNPRRYDNRIDNGGMLDLEVRDYRSEVPRM
jgi:uncharacterized Ntn-hydrolase superfamily protein